METIHVMNDAVQNWQHALWFNFYVNHLHLLDLTTGLDQALWLTSYSFTNQTSMGFGGSGLPNRLMLCSHAHRHLRTGILKVMMLMLVPVPSILIIEARTLHLKPRDS